MCKDQSIQDDLLSITTNFDAIEPLLGILSTMFYWATVNSRGIHRVQRFATYSLLGNFLETIVRAMFVCFNSLQALRTMPFVSPLVSAFIGGGGYAFNIQKTLMIAREVHSNHIASIALIYSLGAKFVSIVGGSITKALMDIRPFGTWICFLSGLACMGMGPALFYCFILRPQRLGQYAAPETNAEGPAWNWIYDISQTFPHDTIRLWLGFIAAAPLQFAIYGLSVQYVPLRFHGRTMSDISFILAICNFASIIFNLLLKYLVGKFRPQSRTNDSPNGHNSFHWYDDLSFVIFYLAVSLVGSLILFLAPSLPVFIVGLVLGTVGGLFTTFSRSKLSMTKEDRRTPSLRASEVIEAGGRMVTAKLLYLFFAIGTRGGENRAWYFPSLPYLLPAFTSFVALVLAVSAIQYQGTIDELRPLLGQTDKSESDPSNIPQEIPDEIARMDRGAEAEDVFNGSPEEETSSEPVEPEGEEQLLGRGGGGDEERGG